MGINACKLGALLPVVVCGVVALGATGRSQGNATVRDILFEDVELLDVYLALTIDCLCVRVGQALCQVLTAGSSLRLERVLRPSVGWFICLFVCLFVLAAGWLAGWSHAVSGTKHPVAWSRTLACAWTTLRFATCMGPSCPCGVKTLSLIHI